MAVIITHNKVATFADEPGAEINKAEWNDVHAVSGLTENTQLNNRLAIIGTSLMQQNNYGLVGTSIAWWSRGWMSWLRANLKGAFQLPIWYDATVIPGWEPSGVPGSTRYFQGNNFGVSGQTCAQIEARLPYIQANYINKFDIIIVDAGTNDMATISKEEIQAYRERICNFFLNLNKKVILLPILARGTGSWPSASSFRKKANWIDSKSRIFCNITSNCKLWDWNRQWIDSQSADGVPKTGFSTDDIHYNPPGGEAVGNDGALFLERLFPDSIARVWSNDDVFDATDNPRGNLLVNGFLTGTTGTLGTAASGVVAAGMRVERSTGTACTVVASKETRVDNAGDWQVMTFNVSGTTEELFYFRTLAANTTHSLGGQWVTASCDVETNNSDCITGISLYLEDNNGTGKLKMYDMQPFDNNTGTNIYWAATYRNIREEIPFYLTPADSTIFRWRVEIRLRGPVTVQPIIKVGRVELRAVDDPR